MGVDFFGDLEGVDIFFIDLGGGRHVFFLIWCGVNFLMSFI